MPRNYVPKPKTYSDLKLQEALDKLRNGELSYREAESMYKVDKSLLWRRMHNYNVSKRGRKTVLSKEDEEDLANKIKTMAKWGWALTRKEIKEVVHTYVVQNHIKNNFKNDCPGNDWLQQFFTRNGLVGKKMEQLEKSRRQATSDPFIIYHFYKILEETLTALDLHDKPQQVFNLDETGFSSDPTRIQGVTGKGQKAHRIIQGSGKDNTTVLGCVSADGRLLPPLIIFKGLNLWSSWKATKEKEIKGTRYACSENGWMLTSIFNEWFESFLRIVTERPLLVIFDGHVTHLDPATIELAVRENVALLKLPPHTTDLLQPMDRSCFGPIKYKWNERLITWQRLNQRALTKSEFCDLLCEVWREGISKEVIQNSFKVTGLFPVNKDMYPKDRLDPVKLDRFNKIVSSLGSVPNPLDVFDQGNRECTSPSLLEVRDSDNDNVIAEPLVDTDANRQDLLRPESTIDSGRNKHDVSVESDEPRPSCSFETLLLNKIKHTKPPIGKRRKIDGRGKVLTSEEYLKSIENIQRKEKKIKEKVPKKKKRKVKDIRRKSDSETDISEGEVPYADESDLEDTTLSALISEAKDDDEDVEELENQNNEQHKTNSLESLKDADTGASPNKDSLINQTNDADYGVGDFVLLGHTIKKNKKYFVARIEGSDDEENISVIYLKRARKIFFVYPDTRIIYSVRRDEIIMKLPNPMQNTKRSGLIFDIDLEKYNIK